MSLIATTLYRIIPTLPAGQPRTIINDNTQPAAYANGKRGDRERHRRRILELIDECGEVDILVLSGELDLARKGIIECLQWMETCGEITRKEPETVGAGQFNTWARRP